MAAHNVRFHRTGVKRLHHPVVGDLSLALEALDLAADAGLRMSAYTAEPGSPSADARNLLASWAVTLDQPEAAPATDEACPAGAWPPGPAPSQPVALSLNWMASRPVHKG